MSGGQSQTTSSSNIFGTVSNSTNTTYNVTYSVIPSTGLCAGTAFNVVVAIDPKPSITQMSTTICNGGFTVTPSNGLNGVVPVNTTYTWLSPTTSSSSLTGGAGLSLIHISEPTRPY